MADCQVMVQSKDQTASDVIFTGAVMIDELSGPSTTLSAPTNPQFLTGRGGALARQLDRLTLTVCLLFSFLGLALAKLVELPVIQWAPWMIGIFFLVLPHGGLDDRTPSLVRGEGLRSRAGLGFYAWYLGLLGLVLLTWALSANLGLLTFLIFSAYHFGQGDLYWSTLDVGAEAQAGRSRWASFLLVAGRGLVSVFLPFIRHDQDSLRIAESLSEQSGQVITLAVWASRHRTGLLAGLGLIALVLIGSAALRVRRLQIDDRAFREIIETVVLVLLMMTTPPVLSVGVYILCWHAPRHILRLMLLDPQHQHDLAERRVRQALVSFHLRSLPLVLAAVVILVLITVFWLRYDLAPEQLVLPAFIFVNAITIPHIVTVTMLDRFQQIWRRGEP